jgi:hypothetical protein
MKTTIRSCDAVLLASWAVVSVQACAKESGDISHLISNQIRLVAVVVGILSGGAAR